MKKNANHKVYKKKYPRAKALRNRKIVKVLSYIFGFTGATMIILWSGTNIDVSLLSTAWLLVVGAVLIALSIGGSLLLDATASPRKDQHKKTYYHIYFNK